MYEIISIFFKTTTRYVSLGTHQQVALDSGTENKTWSNETVGNGYCYCGAWNHDSLINIILFLETH